MVNSHFVDFPRVREILKNNARVKNSDHEARLRKACLSQSCEVQKCIDRVSHVYWSNVVC